MHAYGAQRSLARRRWPLWFCVIIIHMPDLATRAVKWSNAWRTLTFWRPRRVAGKHPLRRCQLSPLRCKLCACCLCLTLRCCLLCLSCLSTAQHALLRQHHASHRLGHAQLPQGGRLLSCGRPHSAASSGLRCPQQLQQRPGSQFGGAIGLQTIRCNYMSLASQATPCFLQLHTPEHHARCNSTPCRAMLNPLHLPPCTSCGPTCCAQPTADRLTGPSLPIQASCMHAIPPNCLVAHPQQPGGGVLPIQHYAGEGIKV